MIDDTPENANTVLALTKASLEVGADFRFDAGVLMIPLADLGEVLRAIGDRCAVLGFDSFTFEFDVIHPRLDYVTDFGDGVSAEQALASICDWPTHLWVEAVIEFVD